MASPRGRRRHGCRRHLRRRPRRVRGAAAPVRHARPGDRRAGRTAPRAAHDPGDPGTQPAAQLALGSGLVPLSPGVRGLLPGTTAVAMVIVQTADAAVVGVIRDRLKTLRPLRTDVDTGEVEQMFALLLGGIRATGHEPAAMAAERALALVLDSLRAGTELARSLAVRSPPGISTSTESTTGPSVEWHAADVSSLPRGRSSVPPPPAAVPRCPAGALRPGCPGRLPAAPRPPGRSAPRSSSASARHA